MLNHSLLRYDSEGRIRYTFTAPTHFTGGVPFAGGLLSVGGGALDHFHQSNPFLIGGLVAITGSDVDHFSQGGLPHDIGGYVSNDVVAAIDHYNHGLPYTADNKLAFSATEETPLPPPAFSLDFVNDWDASVALVESLGSFSGGDNGTRYNSVGDIEPAVCPRQDYDPVTLEPKGLLIEEASTNLCLQSEAHATAPWSVGGTAQVTENAYSGLGMDFSLIEGNGAGTVIQSLAITTDTAAFTFYLKSAGFDGNEEYILYDDTAAVFRLRLQVAYDGGKLTGTILNSEGVLIKTTELSDGIYKFECRSLSTIVPANDNRVYVQSDNQPGSVQATLCGAVQVEEGEYSSSYIPTTVAALTRTPDNAAVTNVAGFYNDAAGTLVSGAELPYLQDPTTNLTSIGFSDGTAANYTLMRTEGGTTTGIIQMYTGSVEQASTSDLNAIEVGVPYRAAGGYELNNVAVSYNGRDVQEDLTAVMPVGISQLIFGNNSGQYLQGWFQNCDYYNVRASNEQLKDLSR